VLPRTEPLVRDAGERQPGEPHDGKARGFTQTMNLSIFAFPEHDLEPRLVTLDPEAMHLRGARRSTVDLDALLPSLEIIVGNDAGHLGDVYLGGFLPRMKQSRG
jgi:hypothetical protein